MSDLHEINRHINSIDMTKQMTNAMFLLSSARTKKVMSHIEYNKSYYLRVRRAMKSILLLTQGEGIDDKYISPTEGTKPLYITISSDKGLCGSHNSSFMNAVWTAMEEKKPYMLCTAGFMATSFFNKKGIIPDIEWLGMVQDPKLSFARTICDDIIKAYNAGAVDEVILCYTHFINTAKQYPVVKRILPLQIDDFSEEDVVSSPCGSMIYEPSPNEIFQHIVPQYLTGLIHQALCMSYAGENAARMTAMQSSTENAEAMLQKLKTEYNRKRQFGITQSIIEIASSAKYRGGGKQNGQ